MAAISADACTEPGLYKQNVVPHFSTTGGGQKLCTGSLILPVADSISK